jgi:hypothetical protein
VLFHQTKFIGNQPASFAAEMRLKQAAKQRWRWQEVGEWWG